MGNVKYTEYAFAKAYSVFKKSEDIHFIIPLGSMIVHLKSYQYEKNNYNFYTTN